MNNLHTFIAGSAAAFRDGPADIVERALPLAGLAVQTVRWIGRLYFITDGLIYARRTESDAGTVEHRCAFGPANIAVQNCQM